VPLLLTAPKGLLLLKLFLHFNKMVLKVLGGISYSAVMSFLFPGGKLFTLVMISSFVFIVRE
jgi:hypothetical protein